MTFKKLMELSFLDYHIKDKQQEFYYNFRKCYIFENPCLIVWKNGLAYTLKRMSDFKKYGLILEIEKSL